MKGNIEGGWPRRTFLNQMEAVLKKNGLRSEKNKKTCIKRLIDVTEASFNRNPRA